MRQVFKPYNVLCLFVLGLNLCWVPLSFAAKYKIDTHGAHAFIQFRIKHLGYSWLYGRFENFDGEFEFDPNYPEHSKIWVDIDVTSLNSMHAERDKHLRGEKYLNTAKYPKAQFKSTGVKALDEKHFEVVGDFSFFGVTKTIVIDAEHIGGGPDPWGGYRHGFEGRAIIKPADFGLDLTKRLGASATEVELMLTIEGIKKRGHLKK